MAAKMPKDYLRPLGGLEGWLTDAGKIAAHPQKNGCERRLLQNRFPYSLARDKTLGSHVGDLTALCCQSNGMV